MVMGVPLAKKFVPLAVGALSAGVGSAANADAGSRESVIARVIAMASNRFFIAVNSYIIICVLRCANYTRYIGNTQEGIAEI